jgi:hypothetical protein
MEPFPAEQVLPSLSTWMHPPRVPWRTQQRWEKSATFVQLAARASMYQGSPGVTQTTFSPVA